MSQRPYHLAFLGSVDHGKSSLMGRLFLATDALYDDQRTAELEANPALFTDGLKKEQEEGITVDVSYRTLIYKDLRLTIIDCPGHFEYLQNMVTGCSQADGVVLLVDAVIGITEQTQRHFWIAQQLGIKDFIFAINKMDLLNYESARFEFLKQQLEVLMSPYPDLRSAIIPVSAWTGAGVVEMKELHWFKSGTLFKQVQKLVSAHPLQVQQQSLENPVSLVEVQRTVGTQLWAKRLLGSQAACDQVFEDAQWAVDGEHFYHPRLGSSYQAGDYICEGSLVREASRWKAIYLHFSDSCAQIDTGVNWVRRFESHKVTGFKVLRVFNLESLQFEDRSCLEGLQFNGIYEIEITISQKTLSRNYQDSKDLGSFILGDKELLGAGMIIEA